MSLLLAAWNAKDKGVAICKPIFRIFRVRDVIKLIMDVNEIKLACNFHGVIDLRIERLECFGLLTETYFIDMNFWVLF